MSSPEAPSTSCFLTASADFPKPPFVLGITGNADPEGYFDDPAACHSSEEMAALKAKIACILDWITREDKRLIPETGKLADAPRHSGHTNHKSDPWRSLGLKNTPILVLSSLAPGVDTIVAEAVLEYAASHPHVSLAAPLPFPPDIYERSSTFGGDPAKTARFRKILEGIHTQKTPSPVFGVALDNDLIPRGISAREAAEADLTATDPDFDGKPRRLRYRAAGEYVAVHSDLLVAIHDEPHDLLEPWEKTDPPGEGRRKDPQKLKRGLIADLFEAGTVTIVEAKRRGLTHELLAVANNFAWADNGPVLLIPIRRQKRNSLPQSVFEKLPPPGPMRFLHPYDLMPSGVNEADDQNPSWQETGDSRFRRVLDRQEQFNQLSADPAEKKEFAKMTRGISDSAALAFAAGFDPIARIRRRATNRANGLDDLRKKLLSQMFLLIFAAATLYGCFEHWHHHHHHPHAPHPGQWFPADLMDWTRVGLLLGAFACLAFAAVAYFRHRRSGNEEDRFDYRAISEAMRVQFFWKLSGTGRSVASDYMQRQRDELDWIRYVVSSLSLPHETAREDFLSLSRESQVALLEATRRNWVGEQIAYFLGTPDKPGTAAKRERAAHFCHTAGWVLAAAGLASMSLMLVSKLLVPLAIATDHHACQVSQFLVGSGAALLAFHFMKSILTGKHHHAGHGHGEIPAARSFLSWVFGNPLVWGLALVLAGFIFGVSQILGHYHFWPDGANWWIILTGTALLGGALCVAWAERNFHTEEARQYRAMGQLFACADRRLEILIDRYAEAPATGAATGRILFEIHDILHELGCEALDENAEWLIQHRSRPLEMLMAG